MLQREAADQERFLLYLEIMVLILKKKKNFGNWVIFLGSKEATAWWYS